MQICRSIAKINSTKYFKIDQLPILILLFETVAIIIYTFFFQKRRSPYAMLCAICYYLYNLKNVENTHGGVVILVKLQVEVWNFTKINNPPWVFFTFFKLYKRYQIAQRTTYFSESSVTYCRNILENINVNPSHPVHFRELH